MSAIRETLQGLGQIPNVTVRAGALLAEYTRFGIGGPAEVYAETASVQAFVAAVKAVRASGLPTVVIGGGTNLIVSDGGFRGVVLRFTGSRVTAKGVCVTAEAGAVLQDVIDFAIARGLAGIETLSGIPGSLGAAVYGNAGAYGQSMAGVVGAVHFFDGECLRVFSNAECEFRYRESAFKRRKEWIVFSAEIQLAAGSAPALRARADEILAMRNAKFPPTMKCAGSIFKNLILAELPPAVAAQVPDAVVREGKVAAAYFLEQAGAKGLRRGGIHVADYHANLVYNAGGGTAAELREVIAELKRRVRERFALELEEEVQYVGF
jgi:UDP-N-acetylmuramate dehydrogenase